MEVELLARSAGPTISLSPTEAEYVSAAQHVRMHQLLLDFGITELGSIHFFEDNQGKDA